MTRYREWIMCSLTLLLGLTIGWSTSQSRSSIIPNAYAETPSQKVYELRTYYTEEGRLPALHARFKDHTMKLFAKHGMTNVIYFNELDKDGKPLSNKLVYLLSHKSQEAAKASFDAFRKDPEWIAARDASEKDGKIVSKVESQFLAPTEYSPQK